MGNSTWNQTVYSMPASAIAYNTYTTAKDIVPNADYTFPAQFFQIGTKFKVHASGVISSFTSGTLTFQIVMGTTVINQAFDALALVISQTNIKFDLEVVCECRAVGAGTSTTFVATGLFKTAAALLAVAVQPLPSAATITAGTGVDGTATQKLALWAGWSVSNAANSITVEQFEVITYN